MDYTQKVSISKNIKNTNMILICIMASISLLGAVMAIYSLFNQRFIFALIYIIAVVLGFSYVIMRINTVIPTYVAVNDGYIYMQNWDNGIFPFKTESGFIGEFLPAKTVIKRIEISSVSKIYLGSRNYLLKLIDDGEFKRNIKRSDQKYETILKRAEFFYILTNDKKEYFMSVTDFDDEDFAKLLKPVTEANERIDFRCNNRVISKYIPPKRLTL